MKILFGVSAPGTALTFLEGQMRFLVARGHEVSLISPDNEEGGVAAMCERDGVNYHPIAIDREPSLSSDIRSIRSVAATIRKLQPDVSIAGTPKASLLILLAGAMLRIPRRVYLCHGLRFEGFSGVKRSLAVLLERVLAFLATDIVAVSGSVMRGLSDIGVDSGLMTVLGYGSPNGIDIRRFHPIAERDRTELRSALGMTNEGGEVLFVGRITRDKGVRHLRELAEALPDSTLTIVGVPEPAGPQDETELARMSALPNVRFLGSRSNVQEYMQAADVLVLPTRREGMPTVLLEAAAVGLPVVAMRATGTVDAIRHCESGVLVEQSDTGSFVTSVREFVEGRNESFDRRRASELASSRFKREFVWDNWAEFIEGRSA